MVSGDGASFSERELRMLRQATAFAHDIISRSNEEARGADRVAERVRIEISQAWSRGWELFDACIFASQQNGLLLLERGESTRDGHSPKRDVLTLVYCAAVIHLLEIRQLLSAGLWAGAAARWRALHEISVTARTLAQSDVVTAERYIDHSFIVQTQRLSKFWEAHKRGPLSEVELDRRRAAAAVHLAKYSATDEAPFGDAYGWAAHLMPLTRAGDKRQRPTMEALEKLAGLDEMRMLVVSAHGLVHADSAGVAAAILGEPGDWILGPQPLHIETVARPAMLSLQQIVASVYGGFERESNDFTNMLELLGATLVRLASWAADEFMRSPDGSKPT